MNVAPARLWMRRLALATALGMVVAWLGWRAYRAQAGDASALLEDDWYSGHRITDRDGVMLRELPAEDGRRGRPIPLEDVGERLVLATLAAEDARFSDHDGVDRLAILRAALQNARHGEVVSGASTITQQLVKLLDTRGTAGERTLGIKLREAARAQNLEDGAHKDAILEAYFHRLPYGHGWVGPEAAAKGYFGVRARDLSWAQATYLAVLPRSPSFLDPYAHPERVVLRQRALLEGLEEAGLLTADARARAEAEAIELRPLAHAFEAPHFVQSLIGDGRLHEGTQTTTTLDGELQSDIEGLVETHMTKMRERSVDNAAALVVDNTTGDVLAYVGSADFFDPDIAGQVDMIRARRQPGSVLKPFVYGLAFEQGHHGAQMLPDVPTEFVEGGGSVYAPRNFNGDFLGPISAREALAASLNVPVIRLAAQLREGSLLARLHALGFESLTDDASHYGLSLALGSGEVTPLEVARAYVTLARMGEAVELRVLASDPLASPRRVLPRGATAAVVEALGDPAARLRLLQGRSPFDIGYPLALKTGTSSGYRDAWTAGFTHERTVVVWLGNADGSPMREVTGGSGAGPLFADIMRRAMTDVHTRGPLWPDDALAIAHVCPLSGAVSTDACPDAVARRFDPASVPTEPCTVHRHVRETPEGMVCDAAAASVVAVLPEPFDGWLESLPPGAPGKDPHGTPWLREHDVSACGAASTRPVIAMTSPNPGDVLLLAHDGTDHDRVELTASWRGPVGQRPEAVQFVVDGDVVGTSRPPYRVLARLSPGDHEVYARPRDPDDGAGFEGVSFSVR
ncbi:MAG: penicillin-binding protein 1C [Nannocystaceae bacterium]|nr:penicillin-binding protein 1C [bacterium]